MARLVAIGAAAGFFSALFGVGGGIVIVPLLILALGIAERAAMATSLAAIGVTALAGACSSTPSRRGQVAEAALVGIPGALGAVAGTALQQRVPRRALTLASPRCSSVIAVTLLIGVTTVALAVALGFAAGVLAGLFGVGGGILFVPTLLALGLGQLEAEATSLLAILPTVAAGAWRQHALRQRSLAAGARARVLIRRRRRRRLVVAVSVDEEFCAGCSRC